MPVSYSAIHSTARKNNYHEFFPWLLKKPFKRIIVQTTLLEESIKYSKRSLHSTLILIIFPCWCCASLKHLDCFFEIPFESSNTFERPFEHPVHTYLSLRCMKFDVSHAIVKILHTNTKQQYHSSFKQWPLGFGQLLFGTDVTGIHLLSPPILFVRTYVCKT